MSLVRAEHEIQGHNGTQTPQVRVNTQNIDLFTLGKALAASGYFQDAKQEAQAVVKILAGQELGIPPVQAMMGIYIINGKPTLAASLVASIVKRSGKYDYRVKRWDHEGCELDFYERGDLLGASVFLKKDAQLAGLLSGGNKGNWEKFPRNMYFARAITNGARVYCADVFGGPVYTPDELGADVDGDTGEVRSLPAQRQVNQRTGEVIDVTPRVTAASEQAGSYAGATVDGPDPKQLRRQVLDHCSTLGLPTTTKDDIAVCRAYCSAASMQAGQGEIEKIGTLAADRLQPLIGMLEQATKDRAAAFSQLADLDIPTTKEGRPARLEYWGNIIGREVTTSAEILPHEWEKVRSVQDATIKELRAAQAGAANDADPFAEA